MAGRGTVPDAVVNDELEVLEAVGLIRLAPSTGGMRGLHADHVIVDELPRYILGVDAKT
jgi:hypothetical protein